VWCSIDDLASIKICLVSHTTKFFGKNKFTMDMTSVLSFSIFRPTFVVAGGAVGQ
jgi:hypothetical protein